MFEGKFILEIFLVYATKIAKILADYVNEHKNVFFFVLTTFF